MTVRIIGDVHGNHEQYLQLINKCDCSIQLGDFGFDYSCLNLVDGGRHKIIPGNHDNYNQIKFWPDNILQEDFGIVELAEFKSAYIRGAFSVDRAYRILGVSYWDNEEISWEQGKKCITFIKKEKPDIILSHDCPFQAMLQVYTNPAKFDPSLTCQILTNVFFEHHPKIWIFGHHHRNWMNIIDGTRFICLNELSYCDIDECESLACPIIRRYDKNVL